MDIYKEMIDAGIEVSSHYSDLYVPVNEVTTAIISRYEFKCNVTRFRSAITGKAMYDIPFAFTPYWERRQK